MPATPLDFSLSDLGTIKTEVTDGVEALDKALTVAQKFLSVIDPALAPAIGTALSVLSTLEDILAKV